MRRSSDFDLGGFFLHAQSPNAFIRFGRQPVLLFALVVNGTPGLMEPPGAHGADTPGLGSPGVRMCFCKNGKKTQCFQCFLAHQTPWREPDACQQISTRQCSKPTALEILSQQCRVPDTPLVGRGNSKMEGFPGPFQKCFFAIFVPNAAAIGTTPIAQHSTGTPPIVPGIQNKWRVRGSRAPDMELFLNSL